MPPGDIYKYQVRISLLKQEELLPAEAGAKNKEVVFKNDQNPLNEINESGKTKIVANIGHLSSPCLSSAYSW